MSVLRPDSVEALQSAVREAAAVRVRGTGTKQRGPSSDDGTCVIDVRGLTGVLDYTPAEGVLTARAGTTLAEIARVLGAHGQALPFDPPLVEAGATIGGTVAAGVSGSGRLRYGGVRDFITGVRVVDGEGRVIRSGGQVVKNAAGFLLHHAMVGSAGQLGILAEVSLKVFPTPPARCTVVADGLGLEAACAALHRVLTARVDLEALDLVPPGRMLVRIAGPAETLAPRADRVAAAIGSSCERLEGDTDACVWTDAREFSWAGDPASHVLVKVPLTPADLPALDAALEHAGMARRYIAAGGLAWVASTADPEAIGAMLGAHGLAGQVVRGPALDVLGAATGGGFLARVRRVLDPSGRFR